MSIIFTNSYTGLMITGLNSPLNASSVVETFKDLVCDYKEVRNKYTKSSLNINDTIFGNQTGNPFSNNCFSLLSTPRQTSQSILGQSPEFFQFLRDFHIAFLMDGRMEN